MIISGCQRFPALQDEQMVRHLAFFGTFKEANGTGNVWSSNREKIPI
jgi:hypothetical protein